MYGIVGITGTPGTGKKSVAPLIARKLGLKCLALNDLARTYGLVSDAQKEGEADVHGLRRKLRRVEGAAVLYGHLLPYALDRDSVERVVVLRCEPSALKKRLLARGYPRGKVVENVEAELIGVVSADAFDAFGQERCFELVTTDSTPKETAESASAVINGQNRPGPRIDWIPRYESGAKLRSLLSN